MTSFLSYCHLHGRSTCFRLYLRPQAPSSAPQKTNQEPISTATDYQYRHSLTSGLRSFFSITIAFTLTSSVVPLCHQAPPLSLLSASHFGLAKYRPLVDTTSIRCIFTLQLLGSHTNWACFDCCGRYCYDKFPSTLRPRPEHFEYRFLRWSDPLSGFADCFL